LVGSILKINPDTLQSALCFRSVTIRNEVSNIPLKKEEAEDSRDALSKALYGNLFDWLIRRINQSLSKEDVSMTIGILDIFGFEIFENNSFEQFCINYANEKLQQHFNNHIFKLEQDEYKREGVNVSHIDFVDNIGKSQSMQTISYISIIHGETIHGRLVSFLTLRSILSFVSTLLIGDCVIECLNLIEQRPLGILKMMDEEVVVPKGSDQSLLAKMHKAYGEGPSKHKFYEINKRIPNVFVIKHYAGDVTYNINGFRAKNIDKLYEGIQTILLTSGVPLVRELFGAEEEKAAAPALPTSPPPSAPLPGTGTQRAAAMARLSQAPAPAKGPGGSSASSSSGSNAKKGSATLGTQFNGQLVSLMATLMAAEPHYIRCIKPNTIKEPNTIQTEMVLRQMRYAGLFEAIRIRRSGMSH
jgi:myosin heavy subunit